MNDELINKIMELHPRSEDCYPEYCEDCIDYNTCKTLDKVLKIIKENANENCN